MVLFHFFLSFLKSPLCIWDNDVFSIYVKIIFVICHLYFSFIVCCSAIFSPNWCSCVPNQLNPYFLYSLKTYLRFHYVAHTVNSPAFDVMCLCNLLWDHTVYYFSVIGRVLTWPLRCPTFLITEDDKFYLHNIFYILIIWHIWL